MLEFGQGRLEQKVQVGFLQSSPVARAARVQTWWWWWWGHETKVTTV